jgi:hypothetical protein
MSSINAIPVKLDALCLLVKIHHSFFIFLLGHVNIYLGCIPRDIFMELMNSSWFQPLTLLLTGIPGLEAIQIWISISLCIMYLITLLGNCTIFLVIKTTSIPYVSQYIFQSMLAAIDVGLSVSTLPTVLNVFLFNHRQIEFHCCLTDVLHSHLFFYGISYPTVHGL